ncbi:MAG: hypothetical protein OEY93_12490 [Anaerolineae bacterium]|nr:hypothetical protein [Anaerolineae bacterium]
MNKMDQVLPAGERLKIQKGINFLPDDIVVRFFPKLPLHGMPSWIKAEALGMLDMTTTLAELPELSSKEETLVGTTGNTFAAQQTISMRAIGRKRKKGIQTGNNAYKGVCSHIFSQRSVGNHYGFN